MKNRAPLNSPEGAQDLRHGLPLQGRQGGPDKLEAGSLRGSKLGTRSRLRAHVRPTHRHGAN